MDFDFELYLTLAVIISGIIALVDIRYWAPHREKNNIAKQPIIIEYCRSFFPILLIVLLLRSFLAEPFRIPSGSEKPGLLVGDFIVTSKFAYGVRLPVLHTKLINVAEPKVGDTTVFRYPVNPSIDFIKRIIGAPGDHISYINKVLYVNGEPATQKLLGVVTDKDDEGNSWPVELREENLKGVKHKIYIRPDVPAQDFSVVVPPGHYFAMGDNRDNSNDGRYWGFVPEENLVGKALWIWFSWDNDKHRVRWDRMGKAIN